MLPSTLTVLRFSPELAPLLIAAGTPILRPDPHSEAFLKILLEEISKFCGRKGYYISTTDTQWIRDNIVTPWRAGGGLGCDHEDNGQSEPWKFG